jgi:hypothetical protein
VCLPRKVKAMSSKRNTIKRKKKEKQDVKEWQALKMTDSEA